MPSIIRVDSLDDPRVRIFADLKTRARENSSDLFVCEGRWVVERLIASGLTTQSLLVQAGLENEFAASARGRFPVYVLPKSMISALVGFEFHRGVLGCAVRPSIDDVDEFSFDSNDRVTVLLDNVAEAENVGVILRSCAALGVGPIVLSGSTACPFRRRVVRVSMASVFGQRFYRARSALDWASRVASRRDVRLIASCLDPDARDLDDFVDDGRKILLMVGNEARGLSGQWKSQASDRFRIPMAAGTDSLNVASATAIFLNEFRRAAIKNRL